MSKPLNDRRYMSAPRAAKLAGYTPDYAARLAREGKVVAKQIKGRWHVDPDSLKLFALEAEAEKTDRRERLREERLRERMGLLRAAQEKTLRSQVDKTQRSALAQTAMLVSCFFLLFNIVWFSLESRLDVSNLAGGIARIGAELRAAIMVPVPESVFQVASFAFVEDERVRSVSDTNADTTATAPSDRIDFQGIVVFDDADTAARVEEVRSSFSDEVNIQFSGDDTGIITPVFREREGEAYRFLLVPVEQNDP